MLYLLTLYLNKLWVLCFSRRVFPSMYQTLIVNRLNRVFSSSMFNSCAHYFVLTLYAELCMWNKIASVTLTEGRGKWRKRPLLSRRPMKSGYRSGVEYRRRWIRNPVFLDVIKWCFRGSTLPEVDCLRQEMRAVTSSVSSFGDHDEMNV